MTRAVIGVDQAYCEREVGELLPENPLFGGHSVQIGNNDVPSRWIIAQMQRA